MTSFKDVLKAGGDVLKAAGDLGLYLATETGKAALKGVKWAGNTALDVMCTSSESSELKYRYEGYVTDCNYGVRKVLGYALVDLGLKRWRDSYLRDILCRCSGACLLSGPDGRIYSVLANDRSACKQILNGDEKVVQEIRESIANVDLPKDCIVNAAKMIEEMFRCDYGSFIREVFVVSVGEDIEEFVYDDNGETMRDANGNYVKKVVGTNYSVARFKVTFSSYQKINFKVYLDSGSWESLKCHVHGYI